MSKRLLLMRHAKSDWDADYRGDASRPLSRRGLRAAPRMGLFLAAAGWTPDRVVSSNAVRALRTAELAAEAGSWSCDIVVEPRLYGASVAGLIGIIGEQTIGDTLLLVGHEPAVSGALGALCGGGSMRMPTAAVAGMRLATEDWKVSGRGVLQFLVPPRMLPDASRPAS